MRVAYTSALVQLFIGLSPETAAKLKSLQTNALRKPPPRGRGVFSEKRKQKTPEETGVLSLWWVNRIFVRYKKDREFYRLRTSGKEKNFVTGNHAGAGTFAAPICNQLRPVDWQRPAHKTPDTGKYSGQFYTFVPNR